MWGGKPPKILDNPSLNKILALVLALTLTSTIPVKKIGLRVVGGLEFRKGLKTKWVSDYRSRHDDENGARIVKIGAILIW